MEYWLLVYYFDGKFMKKNCLVRWWVVYRVMFVVEFRMLVLVIFWIWFWWICVFFLIGRFVLVFWFSVCFCFWCGWWWCWCNGCVDFLWWWCFFVGIGWFCRCSYCWLRLLLGCLVSVVVVLYLVWLVWVCVGYWWCLVGWCWCCFCLCLVWVWLGWFFVVVGVYDCYWRDYFGCWFEYCWVVGLLIWICVSKCLVGLWWLGWLVWFCSYVL